MRDHSLWSRRTGLASKRQVGAPVAAHCDLGDADGGIEDQPATARTMPTMAWQTGVGDGPNPAAKGLLRTSSRITSGAISNRQMPQPSCGAVAATTWASDAPSPPWRR